MTYGEISPVMRAFVGGWEAFRKLGFRASDLYFLVAKSAKTGKLAAFVALRTQGKEFNIELGPASSPIAMRLEYERVAKAISRGEVPQEDLDRMWQESEPHKRPEEFLYVVHSKGFEVPGSLAS